MLLSRGDRDLGVASQTHLVSQALSRGKKISLLQGIFPTQRLNPGLLHCRQILYQLRGKSKYFLPKLI